MRYALSIWLSAEDGKVSIPDGGEVWVEGPGNAAAFLASTEWWGCTSDPEARILMVGPLADAAAKILRK